MRPLRYAINVTLDGCCHHEAGLPPDEESMRFWTEETERADALLFGRVTYQMMEAAWRRPASGAWPDWKGGREGPVAAGARTGEHGARERPADATPGAVGPDDEARVRDVRPGAGVVGQVLRRAEHGAAGAVLRRDGHEDARPWGVEPRGPGVGLGDVARVRVRLARAEDRLERPPDAGPVRGRPGTHLDRRSHRASVVRGPPVSAGSSGRSRCAARS